MNFNHNEVMAEDRGHPTFFQKTFLECYMQNDVTFLNVNYHVKILGLFFLHIKKDN